jgi:hypothetical protein
MAKKKSKNCGTPLSSLEMINRGVLQKFWMLKIKERLLLKLEQLPF